MSWRPLSLGIAVLVLLLAAALVGPAAADTLVDEILYHSTDTSAVDGPYSNGYARTYAYNTLYLPSIEKRQELSYIGMTFPGNVVSATTLVEGENDLSYTLYDVTKTCRVYVSFEKNYVGSITKTRLLFFFDDWDIGTHTGTGVITFSESVVSCAATENGLHSPNAYFNLIVSGFGYVPQTVTTNIASYQEWKNHLVVESDSTSYIVNLYRNIESKSYPSTINLKQDGSTIFFNTYSSDFSTAYLKSQIDSVQIIATDYDQTWDLDSLDADGDTPAESQYFVLSLSPTTAPIGEPVIATLTAAADAPAYDYLNWQFFPDPAGGERTYRKIDGTWKLYNPGTDAYDLPGTDALNPQFTPSEAGIQNIAVQVYDLAGKKKLADLVKQFEVSESAGTMFPVDVSVFDADTGGGLLRVNLTVKNLQTGETSSSLIQTSSVGHRLLLQVGTTYDLTLSKSGYESRTFTRVGSTTKTLTARLPKSVSPSNPDQVWLYCYVLDGSQAPISGAAVQLSGLSTTLTNSQGLAKISVSTNTTYQYTVSKADYTGVSDEIIIESTSQWKYVTLTPTGAAPTSPVPTGPGATTPDYRSVEEKATSALSILFDHVELFAALAGLVLLCNMLFWIVPGGKR